MKDIALIHGYATELSIPGIRKPLGSLGGFSGWTHLVAANRATVFHWGIPHTIPLIHLLVPQDTYSLYKQELRVASSVETTDQLAKWLQTTQPKTIVCHSMGCHLLLETLHRNPCASSVQKIVFLQADIPAQTVLPVLKNIRLENRYCPWDPTLWLSSLVHNKIRAGLVGLTDTQAHNILTPLWRLPNLHMSSMRSKRLAHSL
jgi:hypothetical protein